MKKRILAIVMSVMMVVAFMPTFAFAAAPAPEKNAKGAWQLKDVDKNIKAAQEEALKKVVQQVQFWEDVQKALESNDPEAKLKEVFQGTGFDQQIRALNRAVKAIAGEENLDNALAEVQDVVEQLKALEDKYHFMAALNAGDHKAFVEAYEAACKDAQTQLDVVMGKLDAALGNLEDGVQAQMKKAADEFIENAKEWNKEWAEGIEAWKTKHDQWDEEMFNEFLKQAQAITGILEAYEGMAQDQRAALQNLINDVQEAYAKNVAAIQKCLGDMAEQFTKEAKDLNERVAAEVAEWRAAHKAMNQAIIAELQKQAAAINAIVDAYEQMAADQRAAVKEQVEKAKAAFEQNVKDVQACISEAANDFIANAKDWNKKWADAIAEWKDNHQSIDELMFNEFMKQAQAVTALLEAYAEIAPYDSEALEELIGKVKAAYEQNVAAIQECLGEVADQFVTEAKAWNEKMAGEVAEWKEAHKEMTDAVIAEFEKQAAAISVIVAAYEDMAAEQCEVVKAQIELAKEAFAENVAALNAYLEEATGAFIVEAQEWAAEWASMKEATREATQEMLQKFMEQMAALDKLIDISADLDIIVDIDIDFTALKELVEEATAAFQANMAALQARIGDVIEAFNEDAQAWADKWAEKAAKVKEFNKEMFEEFMAQAEEFEAILACIAQMAPGEIEAAVKAQIEKAKEIYEANKAAMEACIANALQEFIADAQKCAEKWAEASGITKEMVEEFLAEMAELQALIAAAALIPSAIIADLIEDAQEAFDAVMAAVAAQVDEAADAIVAEVEKIIEAWESGEYDEIIDDIIADIDDAIANIEYLLQDIKEYANGYMEGESYQKVVADLAQANVDLIKAKDELEKTKGELEQANNQITILEQKLQEAQSQENVDKDLIAQYQNALKVAKTAPKIKKAKNKKKKSIVVTWKYKKSLKVTGYQIKYGKKTKTVKANKYKVTIKKLKKGKKYNVKVRAICQVKEKNGKVTKYYSPWSKVKKVRVKK